MPLYLEGMTVYTNVQFAIQQSFYRTETWSGDCHCSADLGVFLNPSGCSISAVGPIQNVVWTSVPPVRLAESQAAPMKVMSQSSAVGH